ncbi:unnamed protein product [Mytilus coruscus]|uniref:Uncharacterized protein n=1 Tax=Mytilus coruscus TaxID=42192 RepID=A0A6J8DSP0_MYTCO|nr:unnamed protein product [Mytilus coruscus]
MAQSLLSKYKPETFKTGRGPASKPPGTAVERVINLIKDTTSCRGIQSGMETESFQTNPHTTIYTLLKEDASQELFESAPSIIDITPPPLSTQGPSLLTGYDPVLAETVIPSDKQKKKTNMTVRFEKCPNPRYPRAAASNIAGQIEKTREGKCSDGHGKEEVRTSIRTVTEISGTWWQF